MDWKAIVGSVAPWLATALTGPLGGAAVGAVADALGLSEKTESAIKTALAGVTPEQMLAMKNADQAFAMQMQAMGFKNTADLEAIAADDRKDARAMQVATHSRMPAFLAIVITFGFFALLGVMVLGHMTSAETPSLSYMLGSLQTAWITAITFYFGSNKESARKTELLAAAPAK